MGASKTLSQPAAIGRGRENSDALSGSFIV
jgi:hypothetical protein